MPEFMDAEVFKPELLLRTCEKIRNGSGISLEDVTLLSNLFGQIMTD